MIRFHVNIDHVATLRNARGTAYPDPVEAAKLCEAAGADGITAHLREDRRHIRDIDVERLRSELTTLLNLEMAATDEMLAIAKRIRPDVVTLVPERREERTTEGGLDVIGAKSAVERVAIACRDAGIKLSLFIEAEAEQVRQSQALGAQQVEFHTGEYSLATDVAARERCLSRLREAAEIAHGLGLEVAAGHGLTRQNVVAVAGVPHLVELNIGHAVVADAVLHGLDWSVREFRRAIAAGAAVRRA